MNDYLELGAVLLVAWVLPVLAVEGFAREMELRGSGVANYRGRKVFLGLGLAWLVPAVAGPLLPLPTVGAVGGAGLFVLVPVAFALGLLDDAYGTGDDRGFRGHFRALRSGRLTTGMLKAIGIVVIALAVSPALENDAATAYSPAMRSVAFLAGAAVIALSANFVNLVDLRPARGLKVYILLAVPAAMAVGALQSQVSSPRMGAGLGALLVLGPAAAVWPYDASERGMLGDAGANAAGAFAGYFAAAALPMPWLVAWAAVLLALNLASERVSFSSLVQRNGALRWLDELGRGKSSETPPE